ncbi:MAG: DUF2333 family protein [Alphaproteobacteria bacterium]
MDSGQALRQLARDVRAAVVNGFAWLRRITGAGARRVAQWAEEREGPVAAIASLSGKWRAVVLVVLVVVLIYPCAAWWASTIDDDAGFGAAAKSLRPGESLMVANIAALIEREVNENGWTPNDTFLWPTALLDNMPHFQEGILTALAHATAKLAGNDPELQEAAEQLAYPPDVWVWRPSASLWPASSEHKYRSAVEALRRYNARLAPVASVRRNPRFLSALLAQAAADMDALSASINAHLDARTGFFISSSADDLFYTAKGQQYGYYIVLKGAERDFADTIRTHGLSVPWRQMMNSLRHGATLRPWFVMNGSPDSLVFPCPLCGEGYYLLRAQLQMREMASALRK